MRAVADLTFSANLFYSRRKIYDHCAAVFIVSRMKWFHGWCLTTCCCIGVVFILQKAAPCAEYLSPYQVVPKPASLNLLGRLLPGTAAMVTAKHPVQTNRLLLQVLVCCQGGNNSNGKKKAQENWWQLHVVSQWLFSFVWLKQYFFVFFLSLKTVQQLQQFAPEN